MAPITRASGVSLGRSVRILEIVGKKVAVDIRSAFNASGAPLVFSLEGLPAGSGLLLKPEGILEGSPNQQDLLATQPLRLVVKAASRSNSKMQGSIDLLVSILGVSPAADKIVAFFTYAGRYVAPLDVRKELGLDVSTTYQYQISGLPKGSGLGVNSSLGMFGGLATEGADLRAVQPLVALVKASSPSQPTQVKTLAVIVTVVPYDPVAELKLPPPEVVKSYQIYVGAAGTDVSEAYKGASASWCAEKCNKAEKCLGFNFAPVSGTCELLSGVTRSTPSDVTFVYVRLLPAEVVLVSLNFQGAPFAFNFSKTVSAKNAVTYSVQGLPKGSGLSMSRAGLLSGTTNDKDAGAKQPILLRMVAVDPKSRFNASVLLILTIAKREPNGEVTATLGTLGQKLTFPVADFFEPPMSQWTFSTKGLPRGSKLAVSKAGILTGTLTNVELNAAQPLYVEVTGTASQSKTRSVTVLLTVMQPPK